MRILHTSDWHLGRSIGPISLLEDQQDFLGWLVELCAAERVDLVVVAGDIYDRAVPPVEALVMFREALLALHAGGHAVAVITGNHDGADRVATYDELLDLSGVYVRGGYAKMGEVIPLSFADGPLDLVLLPFLDPQAAPDELAGVPDGADEEIDDAFSRRLRRTHESVLQAAIEAARPRLRAPRSLAVSHSFVAGGQTSESERQLTVGGAATVDASLFEQFSYTALGHLHRPQQVRPTIHYSGTPLPYSFSEEHAKSVSMVDMASGGEVSVTRVPVPVGRPVRTLTGTMASLLEARPADFPPNALLRAVITDAGVVLDAKQQLSAVYPFVVDIVLTPQRAESESSNILVQRANADSPLATVASFWLESTGQILSSAQSTLIEAALADAERKLASCAR